MKLRMNEQEVVDGICVFVANKVGGTPQDVDVKEIDAKDNEDVKAIAVAYGRTHKLDSEDILEGIFQFLEEYHNCNRHGMFGHIGFTRQEGFWAEVSVNE